MKINFSWNHFKTALFFSSKNFTQGNDWEQMSKFFNCVAGATEIQGLLNNDKIAPMHVKRTRIVYCCQQKWNDVSKF